MLTTNKEIVSLIRKIKKDYYNNLDYKKITDNKSFWKYINHCCRKKTRDLIRQHWLRIVPY